jgi:hypothetical protein
MSKNRKGIPAWNKGLKTKPETIKKCVESRQWFYKSGGPNKGKKLSEETGFNNLVLPKINEAKDVSDLYKSLNNKEEFIKIILKLFEDDDKKRLL